jgi:Domain of unknown function (DUF5666)
MLRWRARSTVGVSTFVLIGWISGSVVPATGAPADVVRDGTIASVGGDGLTVAFAASPTPAMTAVRVSAATRVARRLKTTLEAVKPGDYLAVTAKRGADGALTAVSINIFPPEYKGRVRDGQFPMDSGNVMTNATVMEFAARVEGRMLFLKYRDGATAIAVPSTTEIHRIVIGRLGELRQGMHVVVRGVANADGSIEASSITADE